MSPDPAWNAWFEVQYDLQVGIRDLIQERTKGRSDAFMAAVYFALIETLAEDVRRFITLPDPAHPDGNPDV